MKPLMLMMKSHIDRYRTWTLCGSEILIHAMPSFPRTFPLVLIFAGLAYAAPAPGHSLQILDPAALARTKELVKDKQSPAYPAFQKLIEDANQALTTGPFSVMDKKLVPASGDKHDYLSLGPYWWPDPKKPDGLPYIRRDGETNPTSNDHSTDRISLRKLTASVETLALAYQFSGDEKYAAHASRLLRTWFLDEATKMNPHLKYGQAIPGRVDGRDIGIIDTSKLPIMLDHVVLLTSSEAWTEKHMAGLKKWFGDYLKWLLTSKHGKGEKDKFNNHGTWYDVQIARFALFTGQPGIAKAAIESGKARIASQILPDGRQPHELARTSSFSYSAMNLVGFFQLASIGESIEADLWNDQTEDGRGLKSAIDFLAPFADPEKEWPHKQLNKDNYRIALLPLLLHAQSAYRDPTYGEWIAKMPADTHFSHRAWLLFKP